MEFDHINNRHPLISSHKMNSCHLKLLPKHRPSICEGKTSLPSVDHPVWRPGVLEQNSKSLPARSLFKFLWIRAAEDECCRNVVGAEDPGGEMVII